MKSKKGKGAKIARNLAKSILQYIRGRRYKPATCDVLIRQLDIAPAHEEEFKKVLSDLVENRDLSLQNDRYQIPTNSLLLIGTISVHPKGFGFVKNEQGPDIFIPKHGICDAVDGDEVEVEVAPNPSPKGPEGIIIAILKRSRTFLAGTVIGRSGRHATAYCPLLGPDKPLIVKQPKDVSLKAGDRIICKVAVWSNEQELVEGSLTRLIGNIADPSGKPRRSEGRRPQGFFQRS
jgi:ribonuclease R